MTKEETHNQVDEIIRMYGYRQKLDGAMVSKIIDVIEKPLKAEIEQKEKHAATNAASLKTLNERLKKERAENAELKKENMRLR